MQSSKKLLILGKVWPEPKSSAAGLRMMQLISLFLKDDYSIDFATAAASSVYGEDLAQLGVQTHSIKLNDDGFDELLKELQPDVVLYDRFMIEEQYGWRVRENCPDALTLLDTEDLHFLRQARQSAVKEDRVFVISDCYNDYTKRELASIWRCDLTLIISQFEMELLKKELKVPESILFYLPIFKSKNQNIQPFSVRNDAVFIGNFLHEPNWDAVLQLKKYWKAIKKENPALTLNIFGAYPSQKVNDLHNEKDGFLIHGRAEDAQKVVEDALILLAPIRFGAGLKGKVLEAMSLGTPFLTTSIGIEGVGNFQSKVVEDQLDNWPSVIKRILENSEEWSKHQQEGFEVLEKNFSGSSFSVDFLNCVKSLNSNLVVHRQNHFFGEVLFHHTLQSTKYMSKWIEEKNKR